MSTATLEKTQTAPPEADDELTHIYCGQCYPDPDTRCIAKCGADITYADDVEIMWFGSPKVCIVCRELRKNPCEGCGGW